MKNVLGYPLSRAAAILLSEGVTVEAAEVRSKTGAPEGTERRVVRQTELDETHATLLYAVFKTELSETNA